MLKVEDNFGKKDEHCPLCLIEKNDRKHLTNCSVIKLQCKQDFENKENLYSDIFSNDTDKMSETLHGFAIPFKLSTSGLQFWNWRNATIIYYRHMTSPDVQLRIRLDSVG